MPTFRPNTNNSMGLHLIRIIPYINSGHASLIRKYAHSGNGPISSWIDDLALNQALSNFLQHWPPPPKSHANCGLSAFSLATSNPTYSSPPSPPPLPPPLPPPPPPALTTASPASTIACSGTYARATEASLKAPHGGLHGGLHGGPRMEDFYELHACFTMGLDLWQKVHAMGTCDSQISMQEVHSQGTRRRSSYLKGGGSVTVPA